jgi:hypothetical protein
MQSADAKDSVELNVLIAALIGHHSDLAVLRALQVALAITPKVVMHTHSVISGVAVADVDVPDLQKSKNDNKVPSLS